MSSSIHLPQEHITINFAPSIQEQINIDTFTSLIFPDCGMLYLPPTSYQCLMSKLLHPSLLFSSTIFKITSIHHSPAHFTINVLLLSQFSTSLTQMIHYLTINFYPIILYIWGPDTLSGRPSVHALLTTSHNCFNPIVCTVKSNNNNNIGRECRRWLNRTEESIIALVLFELVLEGSIDWEKTCILNHLKTIKSSKLKEKE